MKAELSPRDPGLKKLIKALSRFDSETEIKEFITDLCTPAELKSLADRFVVAEMIQEGWDYRSISEKTKCSTATITRVARALKFGEGGYQKAIGQVERS